jgi:DNA-binding GntR family transcriptional regulator
MLAPRPAAQTLVRRPALSEQVADSIVDAIAAGTLEPGQRIVETDLAARLKVSRVPVREAVKTLVAQGILESGPSRRIRVAALDETKIDQICEIRTALEKIAGKDASRVYGREPERLAALDAIIASIDAAARRRDAAALNKADIAFHREVCLTAGNAMVLTLWSALSRHIAIIFGRELLTDGAIEVAADQHRELRQLLARGGPRLGRAIEAHIMQQRGPADRHAALAG